ncbi:hypothetical protein [Novosphingobium sp.]|uniref:hypothetical protein n=1 Tax=Novosphingobium sp. TaxID=1874826 RepID=UPI0038BD2389
MTLGNCHAETEELGFSLVEALIALAIIAAITAMLFTTIGQDARTRHAVAERRVAVLVAQSALDRAAAGDGATEGRSQGLDWRIAREPYGTADPFDPAPLEQLTVTVADAGQRPLLTLATVRIKP